MGGLSFTAPLLLAGLALLPALYLLLRRTPPPPQTARLPSLKLLPPEELPPERAKRPPWLVLLLRALIALLLILGLSGPRWQAEPTGDFPERLAIVIDNGWAAAMRWPEMVEAAERRIEALGSAGTRFALIPTAASEDPSEPARFVDAETALAALSALSPQPWQLDRAAAARRLQSAADTLWISDGYESDGASELRSAMDDGELLAFPGRSPIFAAAEPTAGGYAGRLIRPDEAQGPSELRLLSGAGRELETRQVDFQNGGGSFRLELAPGDRADAARLSAGPAAASTTLLTSAGERPRVGLVDSGGSEPPLQTGAFYIRRAAEPDAEIVSLSLADVAGDGANLFFLDDVPVPPETADPLLDRVRDGAVIVSFAGPRIAENGTALSPVHLRAGARAFGGALTWQEPMPVSAFAEDGPLAGLPTPDEALIRRQLLTEAPDDDVMIWAELADGTPLVTARREGDGLLVLVHTSAAPDWSDLPLSGLFETIIGRFLPLAANPAALDIAAEDPWRLVSELSARGTLTDPAASVTIEAENWEAARAGPNTPPGLYRSGDLTRALNVASLIPASFRFEPLQAGSLIPAGDISPPLRFGPWLLLAAALLFLLDCFVALALRGVFRTSLPVRSPAPAAAMIVLGAMTSFAFAAPAVAQEEGTVRLAYIGGTSADAQAEAGLSGLSRVLSRRTAVATGEPVAVRPGDPGLGRYPLIYWPAYARGAMTAAEAANIRAYLARGGLILFDFGQPLGGNTDARQLLSGLALPRLGEVGPDHVLMKSYYLLRRPRGGALWVEAGTEGDSGNVSGVAIGGGDWANVWSGAAAVPPSEREQALRFGVNLVMYALTGTYKADQVHTETLLDRIGRDRAE